MSCWRDRHTVTGYGVGTTGATQAGFIAELEALRGIAIMLVFLMHARIAFNKFLFTEGTAGNVQALAAQSISPWYAYVLGGHTGVSLFFILSGFLLCGPFLLEASGGKRVRRSRYCSRRVLRIMPLYTVAVVVATLFCANRATDLLRGLPFLVFLNSFEGMTTPLWPFSGVWWSLATEAQFYLVLPLLPWFLRSQRGRRVGLAVLLAYGIAYTALVIGSMRLATTAGQMKLVHSLMGRAPLFAFGIMAAAFYQRYGARVKAWAARAVWLHWGGSDLLLFAVVLSLGLFLRRIVSINYFYLEVAWPAWHLVEGALWTAAADEVPRVEPRLRDSRSTVVLDLSVARPHTLPRCAGAPDGVAR
jgi:peptidoglycan/LPS O-acetylase OafA/YrhL